jgi:hypothetical protein
MAWAEDYRQNWIAETLYVFGYINRVHLMRKFDISTPQAAKDFARFMREHPGEMAYDTSRKCYIGSEQQAEAVIAATEHWRICHGT